MRFSLEIDDYKDPCLCEAWVATAVIGSAVIGAGATIYASGKASDAQRDSAQMGIDAQRQMYNQTRSDLTPYRTAGEDALTDLNERMPHLTSDIDVSALLNDPNSTPAKAYDFTKTQGTKAVQNSAAARGLGVSGAALKGAASFVTGLADNTYKSLFDMENVNRTSAYNRLKGLVDTGQNAAAQTGVAGANTANQISSLSVQQGNASAANWNAVGGAINSGANNIGGYAMYKGLYERDGWSEPTTPVGPSWYNG